MALVPAIGKHPWRAKENRSEEEDEYKNRGERTYSADAAQSYNRACLHGGHRVFCCKLYVEFRGSFRDTDTATGLSLLRNCVAHVGVWVLRAKCAGGMSCDVCSLGVKLVTRGRSARGGGARYTAS